ncbi:unannotated protein [freshwater metagenome]|uniref:Unannotated protein n=1 Tax=freshwater metagenome TaxID=449393 RepID=A0A6J7VRN1_9ZZZZ
MSKFRRLLSITLIGFSFILPSAVAAIESVGDPGESWIPPNDAALGEHIFWFADSTGEQSSDLIMNNYQPHQLESPICTSVTQDKCKDGYQYQAILPQCLTNEDINCIVDFGIIDANQNRVSANFQRYFPLRAQNQFIGSPALGVPDGAAGSLYHLPQAPFEGGNSYFVRVKVNGSGDSRGSQIGRFEARIYAANYKDTNLGSQSTDTGMTYAKFTVDGIDDYRWGWSAPGYTGIADCIVTSVKENKCLQRYSFPADTKYFLQIRMSKMPSGWMHGRLTNPNISISSDGSRTIFAIEANPISTPIVYKMYSWVAMPPLLQSQYDTKTACYIDGPEFKANPPRDCYGGRSLGNVDPLKRNIINAPDSWSASGMEQLKLILPYVNDQATAMSSDWSVRTLSGNEMSGANQCFSDASRITGIISTNATQYSAGPPTFDPVEQTLNYQVGAPHFTNKKIEFSGSYDLVIRSDVARCIYGFSNAPVKATISIIAPDGTNKVATTSLIEKDGWMFFSAKGFTYSSPTVQVKLFQEAPTLTPTPTPTPSPSLAPSATPSATPTPDPTPTPTPITSKPSVKKSTIICVKGKTVKKVTSVKPICPKGYTKK